MASLVQLGHREHTEQLYLGLKARPGKPHPSALTKPFLNSCSDAMPFCLCGSTMCAKGNTHVCATVWGYKKHFCLHDMFSLDCPCINLLVSTAEMMWYPLLPSINCTDSFCKRLCFCRLFTPAAAVGFLMACLLCAGSLTCLWKVICIHFYPFEGISASSSLLTVRHVSPYFLCVSLLCGVVSCCGVTLQPFHLSLPFLALTTVSPVNISLPLPMCLPLNNNLTRGVSLS